MRLRTGKGMGIFGAAALIIVLGLGGAAFGEEEAGKAEEAANPLTLTGQIDVVSAYFFRGYNIMDGGLIVQPDFTLTWNAYTGENFSYAPYVEIWGNLTEQKGPRNPRHINEVDLILGNEVTAGNWTFGLAYYYYNSPSDVFDDIHEIQGYVQYGWKVGEVDIAAKVLGAREVADRDGPEDTYLEASLTPSFEVGGTKLSLAVPLTLGMSPDGTYFDDDGHNEFFGFASVGAEASYPLGEHWTLNAGVYYLYLMADSLQAANNGNEHAVWGKVGIGFEY